MLTLTKKGKNFQLEGTMAGRRIRESTHTSDKQLANLKKAEVELAIINGTYEWSAGKNTKSFREVARDYTASRRTGKSRGHMTIVKDLIDYFGHMPVDQITEATVEAYINERCQTRSDNSVRTYLSRITSVINYAANEKLCDKLKIRKPSESESQANAIEDSVLDTIVGMMDPKYIPVLTFIKFTGCRPIEAFKLNYGRINYVTKLVKLISIKGRGGIRPRILPLHDEVWPYLKKEGLAKKTDLVFDNVSLPGLQKAWQVARERAGAVEGSHKNTLYSIRHRFGTKLGREGVPIVVIKDLMGHASLDMTMRYVSTQLADHQLAIGKL